MVTLRTAIFAVVALVSSASAQSNYGRGPSQSVGNRGGSGCGNCFCTDQYQPFCGIDGTRETTYSSRCQFNCAQKCSPGLRIKFEGVCAEKYEDGRGSKNFGGSNFFGTTRRPQTYQTTRRPQTYPTTRRPQSNPGWGAVPQTTPRWNYQQPTTIRWGTYPQTTTSKWGIYPVTSTSRPYYPPVQPPRDNYVQAESQARPKTIPTTSRPWWQQSYEGNSGYGNNGRRSRDAEDDDDFYGSEDDNDV